MVPSAAEPSSPIFAEVRFSRIFVLCFGSQNHNLPAAKLCNFNVMSAWGTSAAVPERWKLESVASSSMGLLIRDLNEYSSQAVMQA